MENKYSIGLTMTRILICFIIIKNMCFYLPLAEDYFGLNGIFPYENYIEQMNFYGLKFLTYPFHIPHFPFIFILTVIILATLYMLASLVPDNVLFMPTNNTNPNFSYKEFLDIN